MCKHTITNLRIKFHKCQVYFSGLPHKYKDNGQRILGKPNGHVFYVDFPFF